MLRRNVDLSRWFINHSFFSSVLSFAAKYLSQEIVSKLSPLAALAHSGLVPDIRIDLEQFNSFQPFNKSGPFKQFQPFKSFKKFETPMQFSFWSFIDSFPGPL
jgi:hypothetical protein